MVSSDLTLDFGRSRVSLHRLRQLIDVLMILVGTDPFTELAVLTRGMRLVPDDDFDVHVLRPKSKRPVSIRANAICTSLTSARRPDYISKISASETTLLVLSIPSIQHLPRSSSPLGRTTTFQSRLRASIQGCECGGRRGCVHEKGDCDPQDEASESNVDAV